MGVAVGPALQPFAQDPPLVPPGSVGNASQAGPRSHAPPGPWQGVMSSPESFSIQARYGDITV